MLSRVVRVKRPTKINPLPPLDVRGGKHRLKTPSSETLSSEGIDIDKLVTAKAEILAAQNEGDYLTPREQREGVLYKTDTQLKAEAVRAEEERNLGEAVNNFVMNAAQDAWRGGDELTTNQVSAYKELFDLFDANGDGSISIDELGHVFRIHLGKALADDDLCKIVEQVDENNSKTIEFNEFLALMASDTWADIEKNEIIKAFSVFDRNKDGYVDAEELRLALTTYGEAMSKEEADELLAIADLDNNGLIDYSEFLTVMTSDEGVINCRQQ